MASRWAHVRPGNGAGPDTSWLRVIAASATGLVTFGLLPAAVVTPAATRTADPARLAVGHLDPGLSTSGRDLQQVVVSNRSYDASAAARAVAAAGGRVEGRLDLVGGVEAAVPANALPALAANPDVLAVTADRTGFLAGRDDRSRWERLYDRVRDRGRSDDDGDDSTPSPTPSPSPSATPTPTGEATPSPLPTSGASTPPATPPAADVPTSTDDSVSRFLKSTGATDAWDRRIYGAGVGVAVLDTGVANHPDLAGRVIHGPDLSGEGTTVDSFGHGTVMAGIIAGNGASTGRKRDSYSGVAPLADVISIKAAGRNASVDVSTVLQAMHWVSVYRHQFNIRVLNLAWGVPSTQDPAVDPLNYAVEKLWRDGIVVVASAGNRGPGASSILKPADDPLVLTVGAYDDREKGETAESIPEWSSRGPTAQGLVKPDVLAPGRKLIAARSFGSWVEQSFPTALLDTHYIRGSGTSEAAAVVSGLAALLISHRPSLTPDQVKHVLRTTAKPLSGATAYQQGSGRVRVERALSASTSSAPVQQAVATGVGSIEDSRGPVHVAATCYGERVVIAGEIDVHCEPWNGTTWTGTTWTGDSWTGTTWTSDAWQGTTWTGTTWTGGNWTGGSWLGTTPWTGTTWTGTTWTGTTWTSDLWQGTTWTGTTWTGTTWTDEELQFQNAFWGDHPPFWTQVPGEQSELLPIDVTVPLGGLR